MDTQLLFLNLIRRALESPSLSGFSVASLYVGAELTVIERASTPLTCDGKRSLRVRGNDSVKPHKQVLIPQDRTGWEPKPKYLLWELRCPECGEIGVEQMGRRGDHEAVTLHPDRDAYDSPIDTRGGYVKVELFCPSGHGFDLIIANHKGSEFIGVVPAGDRNYGDL